MPNKSSALLTFFGFVITANVCSAQEVSSNVFWRATPMSEIMGRTTTRKGPIETPTMCWLGEDKGKVFGSNPSGTTCIVPIKGSFQGQKYDGYYEKLFFLAFADPRRKT